MLSGLNEIITWHKFLSSLKLSCIVTNLSTKTRGRVQPCSPNLGLFTTSDLDSLVAFTDHQTYISIESHSPYVENFQLFLPNKEFKTGSEKVKTSTRIVVTADTEVGSYISADKKKSVVYKLLQKQASYVTVYQEGYRSATCSKEIPKPYSLCNNLPMICHMSTNVADRQSSSHHIVQMEGHGFQCPVWRPKIELAGSQLYN